MVMIKVSPKIELSSLRLRPIPQFFNRDVRTVHVGHVVAVCEGCHFSVSSKGILAHSGSCDVAIDFQTSDWVSESDYASSPAFIEGVIGVIERSEVGIEAIPGSVEGEVVDDTGDWEDSCAGGVSFLRVASIT